MHSQMICTADEFWRCCEPGISTDELVQEHERRRKEGGKASCLWPLTSGEKPNAAFDTASITTIDLAMGVPEVGRMEANGCECDVM